MKLFSKELHTREADIRDPTKVAYFGGWEVGEETITVTKLGRMWRGDEMEQQQSTMGAFELDPRRAGYSG